MDWFTILLIFIFFILPLIQRVVEHSRGGKTSSPAESAADDVEEEWAEPETASRGADRPRQVRAEAGGGWSTGWESWPQPDADTEVRQRAQAERLEIVLQKRPTRTPAQASVPVAHVPPAANEVVPQPRRRAEQVVQAAAPVPARARGSAALRGGLGDANELRRAIILKEILGPPKAVRESDPR